MEHPRWYQTRWVRWPANVLLVLLIFWGVGRFQSRHLIDEAIAAPNFTLVALDGTRHTLSDYRGKRVLLVFWAPWCTVCKLEKDNIERVRRWNDDAIVFSVALSYESMADVREFVSDAGEDERFVLLGTRAVSAAYNIEAFPTHYVIDRDGTVSYAGQGYTTTVGLHWRL